MRAMPAIEVDHAVAAVHLDDRRDQRDHVGADVLDVGRVVDGEAVGELHQRGGRAGLDRVDGAGDVVDGDRGVDERGGLRVVHPDAAGIGEPGQARVVLLPVREQGFVRDRDRDHLAALLGAADGEDAGARGGLGQQAEVAVDILGVGKDARGAGHVAEDAGGRGDGLRGGQRVGERRVELGRGGVARDRPAVLLVDGLMRIAAVVGHLRPGREGPGRQQRQAEQRQGEERQPGSRSFHGGPPGISATARRPPARVACDHHTGSATSAPRAARCSRARGCARASDLRRGR